MTNEWQTECDRLGKIADAAWKRYGDAIDAGEAYPTSLFEDAKKASDAYDRHGELEPAEPTITITQSQVVAIFKKGLPFDVRTAGSCLRQLGIVTGPVYADYRADIEREARSLCNLLSSPASWVSALVDAVAGEGQ